MREIEYRAWQKKTEEMLDVALIDFASKKICSLNSKNHYKNDFKDIKFMEYINIKDKNDKKIFTDDIVNYNFSFKLYDEDDSFCKIYIKGVVTKGIRGVKVRILNSKMFNESKEEIYNVFENRKYVDIRRTNVIDIEIIGNIYENKELLKGIKI